MLPTPGNSLAEEPPPPFAGRLTPLGRIIELPREENHVVWDCSPIRDEAGKVHVFFTRIPLNEKGEWFENFRTKGHIVHAVADKPEGPYSIQEIVLEGRGPGHWDAYGVVNPRIYRVGDEYALFYTSYEIPFPRESYREHIGLLLSRDLKTWRRAADGRPVISPSDDPAAWDYQLVNNASLVRDPSSGLYRLYYRGIGNLNEKSSAANHYRIGFATAKNIEGPWIKSTENPVINPDALPAPDGKTYKGFEDPCVWNEGGVYFMLVKDMGYFNPRAGALFTSSDGIHWGTPQRGYATPDDSPQLLFDDHGKPSYLFVNRYKPAPMSGFVFKID